jgi:hypothetical protein
MPAAKPRQDSAGTLAIVTILVAELVEHHGLLLRHSYEVEEQEGYEAAKSCDPVLQKEGLGNAE